MRVLLDTHLMLWWQADHPWFNKTWSFLCCFFDTKVVFLASTGMHF